jgi:hypothetical protein
LRDRGIEAVTAAFQAYADRGVFRGFSTSAGTRRQVYRFTWLTAVPTAASFNAATRRLRFPDLLPGVRGSSRIGRAVSRVVTAWNGKLSPRPPAHKRFESRRAAAAGSFRGGSFALVVTVKGAQHAYAVRQALNLINDLFLLMRESYPDYLIERFDMPAE